MRISYWSSDVCSSDLFGSRAEWFEALAAEGERVPALDRRPSLSGLRWYWDAFHDLHTCRPYGFGGPLDIPWSAIDQWARRHGIENDEFDALVTVIRAMDRAWLGLQAKRSEEHTAEL